MSKPVKRDLIIAALEARGYCEARVRRMWTDPIFTNLRVWAISPTHARRLDKFGDPVWLATDYGLWRIGRSYSFAKPLNRALRRSLEIEALALRTPTAVQTRKSAEALGL